MDLEFSDADMDIDLFIYDSNEDLITSSTSNTDDESLTFNVTSGSQYFIFIDNDFFASAFPLYSMIIDAPIRQDGNEPNNTFSTATNAGVSEGFSHPEQTIHSDSDDDFHRFTAAGTGNATVDLTFQHSDGDVDLVIYNQSQTLIAQSLSNNDNESATFPVVAGQDYFIHALSPATSIGYDLGLDAPDLQQDQFEANESMAEAEDFGLLSGTVQHDGLTIHSGADEDYFKFTAAADGNATVDLTFIDANGDVDMQIISQSQVFTSNSSSDNESLTFPVELGETYFVRVYGFSTNINPSYDLTIDAPAIQPDQFEPNNGFAQAHDFGTLVGFLQHEGLTKHVAGDSDYFEFTGVNQWQCHRQPDVPARIWRRGSADFGFLAGDDRRFQFVH